MMAASQMNFHDGDPRADDDGAHSVTSNRSRFSQDERRLLINRLIEKKRQHRAGITTSEPSPAIPPSGVILDDFYDTESDPSRFRGGNGSQPRPSYTSQDKSINPISADYQQRAPQHAWGEDGGLPPPPAASQSPPHRAPRRSQSAGPEHRDGSSYSPSANQHQHQHRLVDDSLQGDARAYRIAQTEAAIRQEAFKECTFHPKIYPPPRGSDVGKDRDTPFYARVTRWQSNKDAEAQKRKQNLDRIERADCTFHPKINRNSAIAAAETRNENEDVSTRLFRSNEEAVAMKAKFIEAEVRREEEELRKSCTFRPALATENNKFVYVAPKYLQIDPTKNKDHPLEDPNLKNCTFTPKVKGVRPHMSSAKLYVGTNVVERLTRPVQPAAVDDSMRAFDATFGGDRAVMDIASFLGSLQQPSNVSTSTSAFGRQIPQQQQQQQQSFQTPSHGRGVGVFGSASQTGRQRPSSAPREHGSSLKGSTDAQQGLTAEEREARQQQFQQFLGRQSQSQLRKMRHVDEVKRAETPNFKPELCRHSLEMVSTNHQGDFLNRMEQHMLHKADQHTRRQSSSTEDCSFQPKILPKSEKMRARSVQELSGGDWLRKENSLHVMAMRREQEELNELTFKPEIINKVNGKISKSVLRLSEDPSEHLNWHRGKLAVKAKAREEAAKERELKEKEGCTFAPATKDCPSYIARIAKSMEIIKKARGATPPAPSKPLWR